MTLNRSLWKVAASIPLAATIYMSPSALIYAKSSPPTHRVNTNESRALTSLRGMLKANATVNDKYPNKIHASLAFETLPASQVQKNIDSYNVLNRVVAHIVSIQIDKKPVWQGRDVYVFHAQMKFVEDLTAKKLQLKNIVWNYDYIVVKQKNNAWKVSDVIAHTTIKNQSAIGHFDFAPNIQYKKLTTTFIKGLNLYEGKKHYSQGKVQLDPFGYYYMKKTHEIRLYLFVHNGTKVPVFNISGILSTRAGADVLYSAKLQLSADKFGILMPGKTRFCVIHIPSSDIFNTSVVQAYPKNAMVQTRFVYDSV